jgi:AcrR family transcriptional regulator
MVVTKTREGRATTTQGRSGRRPGATTTRAQILGAARELFAEAGYDRVSLRVIADRAGVNVALISHFFRSKMNLFLESVELPVEPSRVLALFADGDRDAIGERVARFLITAMDQPDVRQTLLGMLRTATSEPRAAELMREVVVRRLWAPLGEALDEPDAELRVSLVATQVVGLLMVRAVLGAEPLRSLDHDLLVAAISPTLQRYLTEPLDDGVV